MKQVVSRTENTNEFYTSERCFISELTNSADDPQLSIAQARVEPGITTRWHRLEGISERYYILKGTGVVEVGNYPAEQVGPGDIVNISPGVRQRITNSGSTDLVFLAICTPRFKQTAYEELE